MNSTFFASANRFFRILAVGFICSASLPLTAGELEVQAANELLNVIHFEKLLDDTIEASVQMLVKSDRKFAKKEKNIRNVFAKLYNAANFRKTMSAAYAETFTKEELQDLIDFYSTSTGQKYAEKQPEIAMRYFQEQQSIIQKNMKEIEKILGG